MGTRRIGLLLCVAVLLAAVPGLARDAYFQVAVKDLQVTEGALPEAGTTLSLSWRQFEAMYPEALVDGDGEAYLMWEFRYWNWPFDFNDQAVLHVRAPAGKAVTGALLIPRTDREHPGMDRVVFRLEAKQASAAAREAFQAAKVAWYERLLHRGVPGAAWFRHQRDEALADARRGVPDEALTAEQRRSRQVDDLADTYDLFTGSRALGENLQLDRVLLPRKGNGSLVELSTIEGITVKEYDWSARLAADKPQLDPLARTVPGDQHALFFPTFSALIQLSDEADGLGTPLLTLFEARSEDAGVKHRYQEQLCLSMSALSRLLGPSVVASVAFTGSDPFLRMGSDVAVLFEAKNPELLMEHIRGKQKAAREAAGLSPVTGRLGAWEYEGVCSQSRHICSYVARHGTLVVVTNSPAQLGRIEATAQGSVPSLGDSQEYLFFRQRYLRGDSRETALLILPDAAIRRWCGPQWRIADSRRIRAAALLSQLHADHVGKVVAGET
jgi:hypothetical protein